MTGVNCLMVARGPTLALLSLDPSTAQRTQARINQQPHADVRELERDELDASLARGLGAQRPRPLPAWLSPELVTAEEQ